MTKIILNKDRFLEVVSETENINDFKNFKEKVEQINEKNSNLDTIKAKTKIPEKQFRKSLERLDHFYRSCSISNAEEKISTTISFMVIKYISDKEESQWTFSRLKKEGKIKLWKEFEGNFENEFKNAQENFLSGKFGGKYEDFKTLILFSKKLTNEIYESIWKRFSRDG